jgi:hypothetical protein
MGWDVGADSIPTQTHMHTNRDTLMDREKEKEREKRETVTETDTQPDRDTHHMLISPPSSKGIC